MVAGELAKARVPVILNPLVEPALVASRHSASIRSRTPRRLAKAGGPDRVETGDSHNARNLTQLAGNAVAYGVPYEDALKAISLNPAKIYGMAGRTGSIETGRSADVVVWSGDPLEVTSAPTRVFIEGRDIPMESRQTLLRDRYLERLRGKAALPPEYTKPEPR